MISYRPLTTTAELEAVVDLEIAVWGMGDSRDAVPMNIMRPISQHGGVVLGAYDDARLIGMLLGFPARLDGTWVLWSHMTGVHPDYQGQGVGLGLKLLQRTWALDYGYREIRWTFDPLQARNATLNLHRLGATAHVYHENYYGVMRDAVNRYGGDDAQPLVIPSDRLEVRWRLRDPLVVARAQGKQPRPSAPIAAVQPEAVVLTPAAAVTEPFALAPALLASETSALRQCFAAVPADVGALPTAQALRWRLALRETLCAAFAAGYAAVDVVTHTGTAYYVLKRAEPWYLYVLSCADQSLYTGITNDVVRRLHAHNSGRGAAYTAPSSRRPLRLAALWRFADSTAARRAEAAFKALSRPAKLRHLETGSAYQGGVFVNIAEFTP